MKKSIIVMITILTLSCLTYSQVKIGFVNTQQIIAGTHIGFKVSKKLEARQKAERDKLMLLQNKIKRLESDLKSGTLDKNQKQAKSREIFQTKRELKSKYDKLTADFQKYSQTELVALEKKMNPIITEIGRSQGFTAIYDMQRSGTIFINPSVNITKQVIDAINLKYPK